MADFDINVTGTIADDSVTNAKLAPMTQARFIGAAVGSGLNNPTYLRADQASTILDAATDPFARTSAVDPAGSAAAAQAAAIAAAATDATTKANAAQAAAIAAAATDATTKANAAQAFAIQRANHTGTQLASTISDFNAAALAAAPAETTTTIGSLINGATSKTTPVDADMVGLMDSVASNVLKKLSWLNIKATLKTYFDTLYQTIITFGTGVQTALGVNVGTAGAFVVNGGALGTPSSGSASNLTGTTAAAGTSNTNLSTNAFVQQELALQNPSFLTYSGGSQAYAVTTLAAVNSTSFTFPSTGLYHVQYAIKHDANATTTGANFSVAGTAVFDYLNFLVSYRVDGSTAGRSSYTGLAFSLSGSAGLPAQSSAATTNNRVMVDVWINVTTVGTISLLAASEVAVASGITVTDVKGFMKKESN